MRRSSRLSANNARIHAVVLYPFFDEWGPKGQPSRALIVRRAGTVWLYCDALSDPKDAAGLRGIRRRARDALAAPGMPGWTKFSGVALADGVLAQDQEHCVALPDGPWWESGR